MLLRGVCCKDLPVPLACRLHILRRMGSRAHAQRHALPCDAIHVIGLKVMHVERISRSSGHYEEEWLRVQCHPHAC